MGLPPKLELLAVFSSSACGGYIYSRSCTAVNRNVGM